MLKQFTDIKTEYELRESNLKVNHQMELMKIYNNWEEQRKLWNNKIEELTKENKNLTIQIELKKEKK
jgi:hypothetical protein